MIFNSCSKDDSSELNEEGNVKCENQFKITASSNTTKILKLASNAFEVGTFYYKIEDPTGDDSWDDYRSFDLLGRTDVEDIYLECVLPNPIKTGVEYFTKNASREYVDFSDWIYSDSQNAAKTTIKFSNYQYPGRVTGVIISYDINGKVLAKGEFDFISIKPEI